MAILSKNHTSTHAFSPLPTAADIPNKLQHYKDFPLGSNVGSWMLNPVLHLTSVDQSWHSK